MARKPPPRRRPPKPARVPEAALPHEAAGLTPAQYVFALAWLENDFNATQAYLKAHPKATENTASVEGARTLANPKVKAFVRAQLEEAWGPLEASAAEVVGRLGATSRADISLLFDEKDQLLPPRKWPAWMRQAVKEWDREGGKVKLMDLLHVWRVILELTGRLKNPALDAADVLAEAILADVKRRGER